MILNHNSARLHAGERHHAAADILADLDRELQRAEWRCQMIVDDHSPAVGLDLIEQAQLGDRGAHLRVARRACRLAHSFQIDAHAGTVPATPLPFADADAWYSVCRCENSSFLIVLSLASMSMPYSRAILPP